MNELEMRGIYCILNKINYKVYVGSTGRSLSDRWRQHKYNLSSEKCPDNKRNRYLKNSWDKYGKEAFEILLVEEIDKDKSIEYLIEREQFWIDKLEACNRKFGYNSNPIAGIPPISTDPIYYGNLIAKLSVPDGYIVTRPDGKEIEVNNLHLFAKENGLNASGFHNVLRGRKSSCYGYTVRYKNKKLQLKYPPRVTDRSWKKDRVFTVSKQNINKYKVIDPNGNEQIISNLTKLCKENNLNMECMVQVAQGLQFEHKGWKCYFTNMDLYKEKYVYREDSKNTPKYLITTPEGEEYKINSLRNFCKVHNLSYTAMAQVLVGKSTSYKNSWFVKYLDESLNKEVENKKIKYIVTTPDGQIYRLAVLRDFCKEREVSVNFLQKIAHNKLRSDSKNWKCECIKLENVKQE